jgi:hypothetical protein
MLEVIEGQTVIDLTSHFLIVTIFTRATVTPIIYLADAAIIFTDVRCTIVKLCTVRYVPSLHLCTAVPSVYVPPTVSETKFNTHFKTTG